MINVCLYRVLSGYGERPPEASGKYPTLKETNALTLKARGAALRPRHLPEGLPIIEYLPEDHEGPMIHGLVKDPTPDKGRPLCHKAQEREKERKERPS